MIGRSAEPGKQIGSKNALQGIREGQNMAKKTIWLAGTLGILAIAIVALMGAQTNVSQDATIQDLLDLLVTEDGESRLDLIEQMLADIDQEVDLIHTVAQQMLEDQYGFFETEEWTLTDIKYHLNLVEIKIDEIKAKTDCLTCH
ncbi:hypothetical protein ACFLTM_01135 [Candidatus Bipolaricaulota bacterium]